MPVNIQQGNSAGFVVEFLSSAGALVVPSSGTLAVSYTNTSNAPQTDTIGLTLVNSFFTGTWSSTSAALGFANWSVSAPGLTNPAQTGQLRIVQNVLVS